MAGELDVELWSRLPTELMELVLRRLPISSLCKFRAVCKHWSTLPTVTAEDPYFLCFPFRCLQSGHSRPCKLYSFARNQREDLDLSFLAPLLAQHCPGETLGHIVRLDNSCSNGGLLCLVGAICYEEDIDKTVSFLLVCNPLTRTTKFLPSLDPAIFGDYIMPGFHLIAEDYLMHRDPESGAYKIFAVVVEYNVRLHFHMYDSSLGLWEQILTLKLDDVVSRKLRFCSIVFNGVYYNCVRGGKNAYDLSAYNMKEHRWVVAGVKTELDSSIKSVSFLVRNDCLLLLAKTRWNRARVYRIHGDSEEELKLSRLDGSEEINLPEELDWHKAFAYRDSILFLKRAPTDFTVVDIADRKKVVKTRIVPLFPTRLSAYDIYTTATFNLQATL